MDSKKMCKTKEPGIYQLADGRYHLRVTVMDPEDRTKQVAARRTLDAGLTLAQASLQRDLLRDELRAQLAPADQAAAPLRHTLASYTVSWIKGKADRLRPAVLKTYCTQLERHILPDLGDVYMDALVRADVEAWVARAERAERAEGVPYSRATVMGWWDVLRMVVRDAVADLQLPLDPTARVRGPQVRVPPKREQQTLSHEELHDLLRAVADYYPQRYAEVITLAYTGMRAGELYGLKWEDFDARGERLTIQRSASHGSGGEVGLPKTGVGRVVYAPPPVVAALEAHRTEQIVEQHPGLAAGWIFPSLTGGVRDGASLRAPLEIAAQAAKITQHVSPQVLRRTFNSLMVASGVDRITLRAQMGHSDEQMTARYAGVRHEVKKQEVTRGLRLASHDTPT